jgi:WD40 repeat protein
MQSLFSYLDGQDPEAPQPQVFDESSEPRPARRAPRNARIEEAEPPTSSLLVGDDTLFHVVRIVDERATVGRDLGHFPPQVSFDGQDAFLLSVGRYGFVSRLESDVAVRSLHFSSQGSRNVPTCSALRSNRDQNGLEIVVGFSSGLIFYMCGADREQLNPQSIASSAAVVSLLFNDQGLIWALFADGVVLLLDPSLPFQEEEDWNGSTVTNFCAIDGTNPLLASVCSQGKATGLDCHGSFIAVSGRSGVCNIFEWHQSESRLSKIGSFATFFGAALCVKFSRDGLLVVMGGEDDLVSVYCMKHRAIVYRLQGLCSFATSVSFGTEKSHLVAACDSRLCFYRLEEPTTELTLPEASDARRISPIGFVDTARFITNVLWSQGYLIVAEARGTALVYKEGRF